MSFSKDQYRQAGLDIFAAMHQISPDGGECRICGGNDHQAFECGRNPLVAMAICASITKLAEHLRPKLGFTYEQNPKLHDFIEYLSGHMQHMGCQVGPAKVILPPEVTPDLNPGIIGPSAHRIETKPAEYRKALCKLMMDHTPEEMAVKIEKPVSWIMNLINTKVADLPDSMRKINEQS